MTIFIIGVPTAGKSTLAGKVKNHFSLLNVFSYEAIRNGFIKTMPELSMHDRESEARKKIMPEFVVEFARWNSDMTGCVSLVEGTFTEVDKLHDLVAMDDLIICLGYGGKDKYQIADLALARATRDNYLYGCSREKFLAHFYDIEESDKRNMNYCQQNGLLYFDVCEGWEGVEEAVFGQIESKIRVYFPEALPRRK